MKSLKFYSRIIVNIVNNHYEKLINLIFFRNFAPMKGFELNIDKAINALLFIVKELGSDANFHKTFKILYFADQKHLVSFGRPVVGDTYVKMQYGPVPSYVRDLIQGNIPGHSDNFQVYDGKFIKNLSEPNLDYLSETDIDCLKESIAENRNLNFGQLCDKSHDFAWNNATWQIDYEDIFKAVSDDENMLQYIRINILNSNISL